MRRKESGLDIVASLPWPIGLVVGVVAFCLIRYGITSYLLHSASPVLQGLAKGIAGRPFELLAWLVMLACWAAAGVSYLRAKQRKRLMETRSGLESLASLSWREFEMLVGEAYRRQGYSVEETGLSGGGADGGVDLVLRRGSTKELVQCKQWRSRQVNAPRVREMWGLVDHFDADGVRIVCIGEFTHDAMQFAQGKRIDLVNGNRLLALIQSVQTTPRDVSLKEPTKPHPSSLLGPPNSAANSPACPNCGEPMRRRQNRVTRQAFWGCGKYPVCKGTRQMGAERS